MKESLTTFGLTGSLLTYCLIAVDRFAIVYFPMKYSLAVTRNRMYIAIVMVWIYNAFLISGTVIFLGTPHNILEELQHCSLLQVIPMKTYYTVVVPHILFVVLSMLICYIGIMIKLNLRDKQLSNMVQRESSGTQQAVKLAGKVTRTLTLVLGVFIILYFPILIVYVLKALVKIDAVIVDVFVLFFFLNNLVNPFIYYYKMAEFRKLYRSLFGRRD